MANDAFLDVFVMGLDSATIAIVKFQLHSIGDMRDQLAIRLWSMRLSSDLFALWTNRPGSVCIEVNDGNLGDHGDQLETNQWSISALVDLCTLHGALWHSHRAPQIGP